jgi:hypothetical protein
MAFLSSNGIALPTWAEKPGCRQARSLPSEILRDRVSFDETGQQALAEKFHDRVSVPGLERAQGAIVRERAVGHEKVSVRMPPTASSPKRSSPGSSSGWWPRWESSRSA